MADFSMNAARDLALEPGKVIPIAMRRIGCGCSVRSAADARRARG